MLNYHQLTIAERILLAEEIWESIEIDSATATNTLLPKWQKNELKKRLHASKINPENSEDVFKVMKRLESEL